MLGSRSIRPSRSRKILRQGEVKPFQLRIKGSGQRSVYSEYKVKYSYMDARRTANERGDKKIIRGLLKIQVSDPHIGPFAISGQPGEIFGVVGPIRAEGGPFGRA